LIESGQFQLIAIIGGDELGSPTPAHTRLRFAASVAMVVEPDPGC
jgi:hypothetical protein